MSIEETLRESQIKKHIQEDLEDSPEHKIEQVRSW